MQKLRHKSTGQTVEFERVVANGAWLDTFENTDVSKDFSGTFRSEFWEIAPPTNEEIITALEIGSTFHFEFDNGEKSTGYVKTYNNQAMGYAGAKMKPSEFIGSATVVVDFEYPKAKEN